MHYYQHHIGDYRKDTSHLSLLEHGIYRQLLDLYYISEKPLDAKALRLICARTEEEQALALQLLDEFFTKKGDKYYHSRCDAEIIAYHGKKTKAKASAEIRWNKNKDLQDANALQSDSERNANHKPLTINHKPHISAKKASRLSAQFELPDDWIIFCKTERPDLNHDFVFIEFKDYWIAQAGQKGVKQDWFATWRNWVRRQKHQALQTKFKNKSDIVSDAQFENWLNGDKKGLEND